MRHVHAEDGAQDDAQRGITGKGHDQARAIRHFIKHAHLKFDFVVVSGFARSNETCAALKLKADYELPDLQPKGDVGKVFTTLHNWAATAGIPADEVKFLLVTHHPMIEHIVSSIAFGISPDRVCFSHGTLLRLDTHELPPAVHPLRWVVTANIANRLREASFVDAVSNVRESLDAAHKARIVNPLIAKLKSAVARHFARQYREYAKRGIDGLRHFRDESFETVFGVLAAQAYRGGGDLALSQLENLREAKYNPKKKPGAYQLTAAILAADLLETTIGRISELESDEDVRQQFRDWEGSRAESIATNEISKAFHAGGADVASDMSDAWEETGSYVTKTWVTEDDPCDICQENADMGPLSEDEQFASGDSEPPAHPACRCSIEYGRAEA